jgi:hypothetical protein
MKFTKSNASALWLKRAVCAMAQGRVITTHIRPEGGIS